MVFELVWRVELPQPADGTYWRRVGMHDLDRLPTAQLDCRRRRLGLRRRQVHPMRIERRLSSDDARLCGDRLGQLARVPHVQRVRHGRSVPQRPSALRGAGLPRR